MIKLVVDTNIIFSALLNVDSRIGQILINGKFDLYSPEYVRYEIFNHKEKIKRIAKISEPEFLKLYSIILGNITILSHAIIPYEKYSVAEKLCRDIDEDDTVFVAVSEFTGGLLWTGDMKLLVGLKEKGYTKLITTKEVYLEFIGSK